MRNRSFILLAAALVFALVGAAGVYAYDRSSKGTIAAGVHVAGIDLGGLDAEQAQARLEREYLGRLRTPIVVRHGLQTFTLTAEETKAAANIAALIDRAVAEGADESIFTRTWRRVTGADKDVDIEPITVYDHAAADGLVERVRAEIDRRPRNASVKFSPAGMTTEPSLDGVGVRTDDLRAELDLAIVDPRASRTIELPTRETAPAVTTAQIAEKYKTAVVVDRTKFTLSLYQNLKRTKTYDIAVGAVGLETPAGLYHIQNKAIDPAWTKPHSSWIKPSERGDVVPGGTPKNPLKARWLGIFDGAGIHGIDPSQYGTIGHAASHGCVRMRIPDVISLYARVPVGTPIYIG